MKTATVKLFVALWTLITPRMTDTLGQSVPILINYQGKLTDASANPLPNGTYGVAFRIWSKKASTEASDQLIWGQDYNVTLANGIFNVILGAPGGAPVPGAVTTDLGFAFAESNRFVGITVTRGTNGTAIPSAMEIVPRQQILSTPFALIAETAGLANSVSDGTVTTSKLADGSVTAQKLADGAVSSAKIASDSVTEAKLSSSVQAKLIQPMNFRSNTHNIQSGSPSYDSGYINVVDVSGVGELVALSSKISVLGNESNTRAYVRVILDGTTIMDTYTEIRGGNQTWYSGYTDPTSSLAVGLTGASGTGIHVPFYSSLQIAHRLVNGSITFGNNKQSDVKASYLLRP